MKLGNFLEPHPKLKSLCQGAALLALALAPALGSASTYPNTYNKSYGGSHGSHSYETQRSHGDNISPLNYRLSSSLRPFTTYTGVVIDAKPVKVTAYRPGLVPLLFTAVIDTVAGSKLAEVQKDAVQYTLRVGNPGRSNQYQFVSVVQGPESNIAIGAPVLLVTEQLSRNRAEVRVSALPHPELVGVADPTERDFQLHAGRANVAGRSAVVAGWDEKMAREAQLRDFRRDQQLKDAQLRLDIKALTPTRSSPAPGSHTPNSSVRSQEAPGL